MGIDRRDVIIGMTGLAAAPLAGCGGHDLADVKGADMYGLISKITAVDGERDRLSSILLDGLRDMPGNLSYVVANDPTNDHDLWITEVWMDKAAHENSLTLASVQDAIKAGRPLIAGMERIAETQPVGGNGL